MVSDPLDDYWAIPDEPDSDSAAAGQHHSPAR